jgi:hypothetical protein
MLPPAAQIHGQKCMPLESGLGDRLTAPVKRRCPSVTAVNSTKNPAGSGAISALT